MQITDIARDKLKELLDQNKGKYLRVFFSGSGWGGPRIGMALDEPEKDEKPIQVNGVDVLVSEDIRLYVDDTTIDYVVNGLREGFILDGPGRACWYYNNNTTDINRGQT